MSSRDDITQLHSTLREYYGTSDGVPCSVEMTCSFKAFKVGLLQILNGCGSPSISADLESGIRLVCDGTNVQVRKFEVKPPASRERRVELEEYMEED